MDLDDDLLRELGFAHPDLDAVASIYQTLVVESVCPTCGESFDAERGHRGRPQVHCSPRCARIAARRAYRERLRGISIAA